MSTRRAEIETADQIEADWSGTEPSGQDRVQLAILRRLESLDTWGIQTTRPQPGELLEG